MKKIIRISGIVLVLLFMACPSYEVIKGDRNAVGLIGNSDRAITIGSNMDFEDSNLSPWYAWNSASISTTNVRSGSGSLKIENSPASAEQVVNVSPNTTYVYSGYGMVSSGEVVRLGVKNYGGDEVYKEISSNIYEYVSITFTTGETDTAVTIYAYHPSGSGTAYVDDINLTIAEPIVINGDFESSTISPWNAWNNASITTQNTLTGSQAIELGASPSSVEQIIDVTPNTKYTISGSGFVSSGEELRIGVKDHGASETYTTITSTSYGAASILSFTTGLNATTAKIYAYHNSGSSNAYVDDISVSQGEIVDVEEKIWALSWSDEFNYVGAPDSSKWGYEIGYVRNNEPQYYQEDNAYVDGSDLVIEVKANDNGYDYTSSCITTASKEHFTYGRMEMRALISVSSASWAAWWLLGANYENAQPSTGGTVSWPQCGEIDIMEHYNGLDHNNFCDANKSWAGSVSTLRDAEWASTYHVWSLEWDEEYISIFVDDILMAQHATDDIWQLPQYMLLNVALREGTTNLPTMKVDYVRYYEEIK